MGRELRTIVLSKDEFEAAVGRFHEQTKGVEIHPSNIRSLKFGEGEDVTCRIVLDNPLLDGKTEVHLDQSDIIDLMLRFVHDKGHPLPRRGKKSLTWLKDDLAVMIELDWF